MSILGAVYYEKFTPAHSAFDWIKPERYEYCDGFNEDMAQESSIFRHIKDALKGVFH